MGVIRFFSGHNQLEKVMSDTRKATFDIQVGNFEIAQSSGQVRVNCNLDNLEPDTIAWLFEKGLFLAIRNAYASEKDPDNRQDIAQRKCDEICANIINSGRSSSYGQIELAMIRIYAAKVYKGIVPQGGMATVWKEINALPSASLERLRGTAQTMVELEI